VNVHSATSTVPQVPADPGTDRLGARDLVLRNGGILPAGWILTRRTASAGIPHADRLSGRAPPSAAESQDVHSGSALPKIAGPLASQERSAGFATVTANGIGKMAPVGPSVDVARLRHKRRR